MGGEGSLAATGREREWWHHESPWVPRPQRHGTRSRPASDKLREAAARTIQHVVRRSA